jgi:hypothetical protein
LSKISKNGKALHFLYALAEESDSDTGIVLSDFSLPLKGVDAISY